MCVCAGRTVVVQRASILLMAKDGPTRKDKGGIGGGGRSFDGQNLLNNIIAIELDLPHNSLGGDEQ